MGKTVGPGVIADDSAKPADGRRDRAIALSVRSGIDSPPRARDGKQVLATAGDPLKLYSSPTAGSCTVKAGVEVPISEASVPVIQSQMASVSPGNNTPTAAAINAAAAYLKTVADGNSKAILLATDGDPNCAGGSANTSDLVGTVAAIAAARSAGFPVYVVGIGPSVSSLEGRLDASSLGGKSHSHPRKVADRRAWPSCWRSRTCCAHLRIPSHKPCRIGYLRYVAALAAAT